MALRALLRSETSAKHQELDVLVGAAHPFSSVDGYSVYLTAMDALYARFSAALDQVSLLAELPPNADAVRSCLASDLESAKDAASEFKPDTSPAAGSPFELGTCWGIGYTLEGSAMGASYMIQTVRSNLPSQCTTEFLQHLANDSTQRWPVFCKSLDEATCDPTDALAGANLVFQTAVDLFSQAAAVHQVSPKTD